MEPADLQNIHHALVQQWGMWPVGRERLGRETLLEQLSRRVDFLMRHDFDRLMSCMYIMDVPEEKFSEAVRKPDGEKPAQAVAELIFEREIEKFESRRRYSRRERTEVSLRIEEGGGGEG